jgi:hypothetical protein
MVCVCHDNFAVWVALRSGLWADYPCYQKKCPNGYSLGIYRYLLGYCWFDMYSTPLQWYLWGALVGGKIRLMQCLLPVVLSVEVAGDVRWGRVSHEISVVVAPNWLGQWDTGHEWYNDEWACDVLWHSQPVCWSCMPIRAELFFIGSTA